jgi:hypothetical protein
MDSSVFSTIRSRVPCSTSGFPSPIALLLKFYRRLRLYL